MKLTEEEMAPIVAQLAKLDLNRLMRKTIIINGDLYKIKDFQFSLTSAIRRLVKLNTNSKDAYIIALPLFYNKSQKHIILIREQE